MNKIMNVTYLAHRKYLRRVKNRHHHHHHSHHRSGMEIDSRPWKPPKGPGLGKSYLK